MTNSEKLAAVRAILRRGDLSAAQKVTRIHAATKPEVAPPPPPPPTGDSFPSITDAEATHLGTFEGGVLVGGQYGFDSQTVFDYPGKIELVTDKVCEGKYAMRTTHVADNLEQGRSELAFDQGPVGAEGEYEFAFYLPSSVGFYSPTKGFNISQHKQSGAGSSCYSGGLEVYQDGSLVCEVVHACDGHGGETATAHPCGKIPKDRWVGIRVGFKWAVEGYIQVDVDPDAAGPAPYEKRLPRVNCRTIQDTGLGVKHRMGQYGRMTKGGQLWFDSYRLVIR